MNENAANDKRTPGEWCQLLGYEILDPDGWRHPAAPRWDDPITRDDFERRLAQSTARKL